MGLAVGPGDWVLNCGLSWGGSTTGGGFLVGCELWGALSSPLWHFGGYGPLYPGGGWLLRCFGLLLSLSRRYFCL